MACSGAFADSNDFATFWMAEVKVEDEADLNRKLEMAASDIHVSMAASGACDCSLAAWALDYLKKLNVIEVAAFYPNVCGIRLTDEQRRLYLEWINDQMDKIRDGRIELCAGETGSETPAVGWAEQGVTEFAAARIIKNDIDRNAS